MEQTKYAFKKLGQESIDEVKELFVSVFTAEPWNDNWSDKEQLNSYIYELTGQSNSLTYGLYENAQLIAVSIGHIKHWFTGTEYYIDELCVRSNKQGHGVGSLFLKEIETDIKRMGMKHIFLQTESNVPAYSFYLKQGFFELKEHVSFAKDI